MSAPRDLYILDKAEIEKAMMIVKSPAFNRLLVFSIAEFSSANPSKEETQGANKFMAILKSLPDDPGSTPEFPTAGLQHEEATSNTFAINLKPTN